MPIPTNLCLVVFPLISHVNESLWSAFKKFVTLGVMTRYYGTDDNNLRLISSNGLGNSWSSSPELSSEYILSLIANEFLSAKVKHGVALNVGEVHTFQELGTTLIDMGGQNWIDFVEIANEEPPNGVELEKAASQLLNADLKHLIEKLNEITKIVLVV